MYMSIDEGYLEKPTVYDRIFRSVKSNSAYEQMLNTLELGDLVEREIGDDIVFEKIKQGREKVVKARSFSKGFEIPKEMVDDYPDQGVNFVAEKAKDWGNIVRRHKEKTAASLFNKGGYTSGDPIFNNSTTGVRTDPSGDLIYDNKPFFNLSGNLRSSLNGGTYSNATALTFSGNNLKTQLDLMTTNAKNEMDEIVDIEPDVLLIPTQLRWQADQEINSTLLPGGGNNDINPLKGIVEVLPWRYLTNPTAWYLGALGKGLLWVERQEPEIEIFRNNINKNYGCTIDLRYGLVVTDWRYWSASNSPTS